MEFLISVSVLGTTYALLAAGIVVVYKACRVVNFAHGELAIVGAYGFFGRPVGRGHPRLPVVAAGPIAMRPGSASCSASRSISR